MICRGDRSMLRKTALAVALMAAVVAGALAPTIATARGGHAGGHDGGHGGGHVFHGGVHSVGHVHGGFHSVSYVGGDFRRGFRGFGAYAYYDDYGCWRWFLSRWGYVRVWVC